MKILINGKSPYECTLAEISAAFSELRMASKLQQQRTAASFYPGQYVSWVSRRTGSRVVGKIERVNKQSIAIVEIEPKTGTITNRHWKVSPSLLSLYNG